MNGLYPPIVESRPRGGSANSLFVLATEERPLVGRSALRGFNSAGSKPPESSQVPLQVLTNLVTDPVVKSDFRVHTKSHLKNNF